MKKKKLLVFIPVSNEANLDRTALERLSDKEVWEKLTDECKIYDLSRNDRQGRMPDILDFVVDYNDEELDGGWWSTYLEIPEELLSDI